MISPPPPSPLAVKNDAPKATVPPTAPETLSQTLNPKTIAIGELSRKARSLRRELKWPAHKKSLDEFGV